MEANEVAIIIASVSGLIVTVATAFLKYLGSITKADREERVTTAKYYADSLEMLSKNLQENTESNRRIADEAKERNGHLAELQLKSQEMIDRNFECYKTGMLELKNQHVKSKTVDKQIIK